ncbi:MAG: hypothetical protein H7Z43_11815, partial [Clostridia bacterium]|nr:hypothetical protein [Deltaproteobacteria bacterium]
MKPLYEGIRDNQGCTREQFEKLNKAGGTLFGKEEHVRIKEVAENLINISGYNKSSDDDEIVLEALARDWLNKHPNPALYFGNGPINLALDPVRQVKATLVGGGIGSVIGIPVGAVAGRAAAAA